MTSNDLKNKFKQEYNTNILCWSETVNENYIKWLENRVIYLERKLAVEREIRG